MTADVPDRTLPPGVRHFIAKYVDTLDKLELLTLMIESADKWWDATSAAQALRISAGATHDMLERFAVQNLLAIRVTGDVRYQYQPGDPRLKEAAAAFAAAYRTHRLDVLRLVTTTRSSVRDFADAFRIRRDDTR